MNRLFKTGSSSSSPSSKDHFIKKAITTQLSNSVKEIQYSGIDDGTLSKADDLTDALNTLCSTIEAIFLHGLRDSFTRRFRRALADVDERPEPSFWAPLLIISHRQIIDQIMHLSQVNTEVGQCRAWVRLALNDCLLSSYLMAMRRDPGAFKSFYKPSAYARDAELLDVSQRLIEGVEAFKTFTLPCNSSLLNTWQLPCLLLAGIWAPTMKNITQVAPCDDVAQSLDEASRLASDSGSETCSLSSAMSVASLTSGLRQMVALNEDEALKIILAKHKGNQVAAVQQQDEAGKSSSGVSDSEEQRNSDSEVQRNFSTGNSLNRLAGGWSFDETQPIADTSEIQDPTVETPQEPKSTEASFNALIESYNMLSGGYIKTPDWKDMLNKLDKANDPQDKALPRNNSGSVINCIFPDEYNRTEPPENWKETPLSPSLSTRSDPILLTELIGKLANERGLDAQDYECADCHQALGISSKPIVCAFTGEYFCDSCMSEEHLPIPARIIHNWDFKLYPVSRRAFKYIDEIKTHPTIDFKIVNPFIYEAIEEMQQLQTLRNQLNFLRAYLYTCKEPIIEELQKQMWPREYMYEHIHQYSVSDLLEISNGLLAQQLQSVVSFGRDHVICCWLCSQKGFVCEVCNKPKPLFPFDVELVYRCDVCNAVYHKTCLNSSMPCRKCKRRRQREDVPSVGAPLD